MIDEPQEYDYECFACGSGCNGNWVECNCLEDPECEDCDGTFWLNAEVPICHSCMMESVKSEKADEERKER